MTLFLDANILLRAILGDVPEDAMQCTKLLERIDNRELEACTSVLVLNEVLWVLEGLNLPTEEISDRVLAIARSRVTLLPCEDGDSVEEATALYVEKGVDFQDALNAITAVGSGVTRIVSYDKHFDQLETVERIEPGELAG